MGITSTIIQIGQTLLAMDANIFFRNGNFVPFTDGSPSGMPEDILDGFVTADGEALGRPVGVAVDRSDALLVADDVAVISSGG